jgi:citrate lyase subunit beta / citryl-CoA lyase
MQLMRSLLFVPANRQNMIQRAHEVAADVIVLDLEDAVPPAEKAGSRTGLRAAVESLTAAGKTVHLRINHTDTGMTRDDLAAAVGPGLDGLEFPKTEGAAHIRELDVLIREQELHNGVKPGTIGLFPMIETARGLLRCEEISLASTRIRGLVLGGEDFVVNLGVARTSEGRELEHARRVIITCAAAYKLAALDAIYPNFNDEAGLIADTAYARSIGFKGKFVIHPSQVGPVNAAFSPSSEEIEFAQRVLSAFDEAVGQGHGSVQVDGRMVDAPVAQRARDLVAYAEALGQRS